MAKRPQKRLEALTERLEAAQRRAWARMTEADLLTLANWPERAAYTGEAAAAVRALNRLIREELNGHS